MLPWILAEQPPPKTLTPTQTGASSSRHTDFDYKEKMDTGRFGSFVSSEAKATHSKTCMVDALATVWEQAHLIPQALSPHDFKTVLASEWLFFQHAAEVEPTQLSTEANDILNQAEHLVGQLSPDVTPEELSTVLHGLNICSSRDNNMLPLNPQLHTLSDDGEWWLDPFAHVAVWAAKTEMPPALICNIAGAFSQPLLRAFLTRHSVSEEPQFKPIKPAMFANACYNALSLMATAEFKERLRERAKPIIVRRKAGLPRADKFGKHKRDDSSDEDGDGGDAKQPRTGGHPAAGFRRPSRAAASGSGQGAQDGDGHSSVSGSRASSRTAGWAYGPSSSRIASDTILTSAIDRDEARWSDPTSSCARTSSRETTTALTTWTPASHRGAARLES